MHVPAFFNVIVSVTLKATVLLALGWAGGLLLKDRPAATRHMARAFVLCAVLLLPLFTLLVPAWRVKGIPELLPAKPAAASTASVALADKPSPLPTFQSEARPAASVPLPVTQRHRRLEPATRPVTSTATATISPTPSSPQSFKATSLSVTFDW